MTPEARTGASGNASPGATIEVTETGGRVRFAVHVQPRASRNEISGAQGGALRVRLTAPPVEGAANEALIEFLSRQLDVRRSSIRILRGQSTRHKIVEVQGITAAALRDRLYQGR